MSNQLTVFSSGVLSWYIKVDTLGRLCDNNLERSFILFITTKPIFYWSCV